MVTLEISKLFYPFPTTAGILEHLNSVYSLFAFKFFNLIFIFLDLYLEGS